jgi:hypothetical protein
MDTVGIRVPTRQIRAFSTYSVISDVKLSPSARLLQMTYRFFYIYLAKTMPLLRTHTPYRRVS